MKAAAFPEFLSEELKSLNIFRPFPLPSRTEGRFKLPERQPTLIADIGSKLKTDSDDEGFLDPTFHLKSLWGHPRPIYDFLFSITIEPMSRYDRLNYSGKINSWLRIVYQQGWEKELKGPWLVSFQLLARQEALN